MILKEETSKPRDSTQTCSSGSVQLCGTLLTKASVWTPTAQPFKRGQLVWVGYHRMVIRFILLPQTLSLAIPHAGGGEFSRLSFRGLTRPRR